MNNLTSNLSHIVVTVVVIIVTGALAWHGTISGTDAFGLIAAIGGVSVGGGVASSSAGTSAPSSASGPVSTPVSTSALSATDQTSATAVFPVTATQTSGGAS